MTILLKRILLADDNDANRLISQTILERSGYLVTPAKNGSHALSLADIEVYDLIVLDIMMPVMDGMRALRQLRRVRGPNQKTPVFALTSFANIQDRQRYLLAGFDTILSKPLRPGDMETALMRYISKRAMPLPHSPRPGAHASVPILDEDIISQLSEIADPERLATIQMRFWHSVEKQCSTIKQTLPEALRGTDPYLSQFRRSIHAIKGASAAIGLSRVAQICRQLQNAPPPDIASLLSLLIKSLEDSRPLLTQALSRPREFNAAMEMSGEDQPKTAHNG